MEISNKTIKLGYILSVVCFIIGLRIALSWSYNSRLTGIFLILFSAFIAHKCYIKTCTIGNNKSYINKKQALLGLFLIIIDISYNIISADLFKSFDYGVITAGVLIILLNVGFLYFLNLDRKVISFITLFIFITMILYGFLFSGLPFLLGNKEYNFLFDFTTKSVVLIAGYILNFIKPTTFMGNTVNFNGFSVWVGDPCSGVESISIFFSSLIAYMIATKIKDNKKMLKYMLVGIIVLYSINILRIIIIILTGYYLGIEKMLFVHYHLGWIFFLVSMGIFWNYLIKDVESKKPFQK